MEVTVKNCSVFLVVCFVLLYGVKCQMVVNQTTLDEVSRTLGVQYAIVTNTKEEYACSVTVTLTNRGHMVLENGDWTIYWTSSALVEPQALTESGDGLVIAGQGLEVTRVSGLLYSLKPLADFRSLAPGDARVLRLKLSNWQVSQSDVFPNWYMVGSNGTEARVITSTAELDASFAIPPRYPRQQKRYEADYYAEITPQERYQRNFVPYADPNEEVRLIPRPWRMLLTPGQQVNLSSAWIVIDMTPGKTLSNEVNFIVEKLARFSVRNGTNLNGPVPSSNVILLNTGTVVIPDTGVQGGHPDAHAVEVSAARQMVNVTGGGPSGVLLGLQTVLALLGEDGALPQVTVYDAPRFSHRGLFLDLSSNFFSADDVKRVLEAMAAYKLNRLHLLLAGDHGWRIEIADLPELTQVGATRCHDPIWDQCLWPQLGSGPFSNSSGSGFLTARDYRDVLSAASKLHIQVIPEISLPGRSHAAIRAMEKRYRTLAASGNTTEAEQFRLLDPADTPRETQRESTVNVCLNSTYAFISKVVREIKKLHGGEQPLTEFHCGLREMDEHVWVNISRCWTLQSSDPLARHSLQQYFFKRVAGIMRSEGLALGGWEDGFILQNNSPLNRSLAPDTEVTAYMWNNTWESETSPRTYNLANMGYKVVMSYASALSLDHPSEPAWAELGRCWATRFVDAQKVFSFMPADLYANIDTRSSGQPITRAEVCGNNDASCPPLQKPENIVGLQAQLWTENVRSRDHLDMALFPRLLALAERAWHKADWEREANATVREGLRQKDWQAFARALGRRELPRLQRLGLQYNVPPPGAVVERQKLLLATSYPGLAVEYSRDSGVSWSLADGTERVKDSDHLLLRSRTHDGRYSRTVELSPVTPLPVVPSSLLDYMGENLVVMFEVVDNYETYSVNFYVVAITLHNAGRQPITTGNWELHFPSVRWVEKDQLIVEREFILQDQKMALSHYSGYQFKLSPLADFPALLPNTSRAMRFKCQYWSVSKYEQFPNYFVVADGAHARLIKNTMGESMSFVKDFAKPNQWKRDVTDKFDPLTPSARYGKQEDTADRRGDRGPYLPTPQKVELYDSSKTVSLAADWSIVAPNEWTAVADFLKEQLNFTGWDIQTTAPAKRYVQLKMSSEGVPTSSIPGAYRLVVSPEQETVVISATNVTGALYGVQSLINMALQSADGLSVSKLTTQDAPRFEFRGMYLDVARNFHGKASVLKLLQVMGLMKLNRLHLHLGDDEGWRLEISGLPELTTMGSKRCYDPTEEECVVPVMGAGPYANTSGTGFYTIQDYQEILTFAARRHIEVIPEFDMPGHSRAAIKAMALRRRLLQEAGDPTGAEEFALDELGDPSQYSSVQFYNDDAVNPCLNSTYTFIRHVMRQVKKIHGSVNPLRTYHFGGDEVAHGAWVDSKACSKYVQQGADLKALFSTSVARLAAEEGLELAAWEDGLLDNDAPIPRANMSAGSVYANAWSNIWERGGARQGYELANAGYKVVMSQATHLYFDHPYEPDPTERGFYWATRYTDTRKVFLFQPDHLWHNVEITRMGDPITLKEVCQEDRSGCPPLAKKENVIGMQGLLWTETVRTAGQVEYMIFPRLLALAERAWHRATWEGQDGDVKAAKTADWSAFASTVGYGQLALLDKLNVAYRLCPPGVRQEGGKLMVNTEFPGLQTQYRVSGTSTWTDVTNKQIPVTGRQIVYVKTLSVNRQRESVPVMVNVTVTTVTSHATHPLSSAASVVSLSLCVLVARV